MKVAHFIASDGIYGAEKMLLELMQAQQKIGDKPTLVINKKTEHDVVAIEEKAREIGIATYSWVAKNPFNPSSLLALRRVIDEISPFAIHSHGYRFNTALGIIKRRSDNLITTLHGNTKHPFFSKMTINRLVETFCLRRFKAYALVSPSQKKSIFLPKRKYNIVYNCIPSTKSRARATNQTPIPVMGSLGRLAKEKNFSFLLDVCYELKKINLQFKCIIRGEGPEHSELIKKVHQLGLEGTVFIEPYTEDIDKFYRNLDLYINCSTTEGMPMTLLEAAAYGVNISASNISGNIALLREISTEDKTFPLDVDIAAKKIYQSLIHKDNNTYNLEKFSAINMYESYKTIYEKQYKH